MPIEELRAAELRLITPRALRAYAEGLGWQKVDGVNGVISAFRNPHETNRQLIVAMDESLDDYVERTADAVERLAAFEGRTYRDVLSHLLLPPADVLSFRVVSPDTETGDVLLEQGAKLIDGARIGLLATAHSVEVPRAFHPRLGRDEAKKFLSRCRMSTGRGSFILSVSCLLDQTPALPGLEEEPFTRRVTRLFIETLNELNRATGQTDASRLVDLTQVPGMSANLCEALLELRPTGERAVVRVSAAWSRAMLPTSRKTFEEVQLDQSSFKLAESLATRLRSSPKPEIHWFLGFVEELKGVASPDDPRPAGEVRFRLFLKDEEFFAKADLSADDYARAGEAHLNSRPVGMRGELHRQPRGARLDKITQFQLIDFENEPAT